MNKYLKRFVERGLPLGLTNLLSVIVTTIDWKLGAISVLIFISVWTIMD